MAAEGNAKNSDSPAVREDTPTTYWSIGRAEMKQQAKKESIKQEKKKRKRKAEGNHRLCGSIIAVAHSILLRWLDRSHNIVQL